MSKILLNILRIIVNWARWSEMVALKLPDIMSGSITFENILSIRVLEWVATKIKGINDLETRARRRPPRLKDV